MLFSFFLSCLFCLCFFSFRWFRCILFTVFLNCVSEVSLAFRNRSITIGLARLVAIALFGGGGCPPSLLVVVDLVSFGGGGVGFCMFRARTACIINSLVIYFNSTYVRLDEIQWIRSRMVLCIWERPPKSGQSRKNERNKMELKDTIEKNGNTQSRKSFRLDALGSVLDLKKKLS